MPMNKWKSAHLVIAFVWVVHALSWYLPAFGDSSDSVRGWFAFWLALWPIRREYPGAIADPWYYSALAHASAATTFMFAVGSPLAVWRGSRSVRRAYAWIAITAFIFNSHWYVFPHWVSREDLSVGYFLWWLSFGLLAIGLFKLSSHSTANHYKHLPQTEVQETHVNPA